MSNSTNELNVLIDNWCQTHLAAGCSGVPADRLDELKDHLLCVAESRIEQGHTVQDAVEYAVKQFGDPEEVREQLHTGQSAFRRWIGKAHCNRQKAISTNSSKPVIVSIIIAVAMLISAWLTKDAESQSFIFYILIATWVVIVGSMGGTRAAARAEWQWLKRKLGIGSR